MPDRTPTGDLRERLADALHRHTIATGLPTPFPPDFPEDPWLEAAKRADQARADAVLPVVEAEVRRREHAVPDDDERCESMSPALIGGRPRRCTLRHGHWAHFAQGTAWYCACDENTQRAEEAERQGDEALAEVGRLHAQLERHTEYQCPQCFRWAPWTDGTSVRLGDDGAEFWCQTCGTESPLTACSQRMVIDGLKFERDEALAALREFVDDRQCDPHPGNGFCQTHGEKAPCPHAAAKKLLALDQPGTGPDRCPSCDHLASIHQPEGCWFAVTVGTVGRDLVCPCTVPRPAPDQPEETR